MLSISNIKGHDQRKDTVDAHVNKWVYKGTKELGEWLIYSHFLDYPGDAKFAFACSPRVLDYSPLGRVAKQVADVI